MHQYLFLLQKQSQTVYQRLKLLSQLCGKILKQTRTHKEITISILKFDLSCFIFSLINLVIIFADLLDVYNLPELYLTFISVSINLAFVFADLFIVENLPDHMTSTLVCCKFWKMGITPLYPTHIP